MRSPLFNIGSYWINLNFLVKMEIWPGNPAMTYKDEQEDRLFIKLLNDSVQITLEELKASGHPSVDDCVSEIGDAMIELGLTA